MRNKRLLILFGMMLISFSAFSQTAAYSGFCDQGGVSAVTSGLSSTNRLQGIIPYCTVTVYLTGTTTKATIYKDSVNTPQTNPYRTLANGQITFYAATGQGYDIVKSGGISPLIYTTPLTVTDWIVGAGGGSGVSQIIAGSNVTVTPSGGTGVVTISATGGGGVDSVLYNPATTGYLWTGDSRLVDDQNSLGPVITATSVNCNGTVCIVTAPNTYIAGQRVWVFGSFSPSFLVGGGGFSTYWYGDGNGVYTVLSTGLSSTQFEFAYTAHTGTGTGGTIEDADWFVPYVTAKLPFFNGHGDTIMVNSGSAQQAVANYSTLYQSYCASATPTAPKYFIITSGYNDISSGTRTAPQVEGDLLSLYTSAHADGCIVVAGTIPTSTVNGFVDNAVYRWVNDWIRQQSKWSGNVASGGYYDFLVDLAGKCSQGQLCFNNAQPNILGPFGVNIWSTAFNQSLSAQTTIPDPYPGLFENGTSGPILYIDRGAKLSICDSGTQQFGGVDPICPIFVNTESGSDYVRVDALRIKNLTPSTSPLCASGSNGEVTNVGCSGGGTDIANIQITVDTTTIPAGTCLAYHTATMTGLASTSAIINPAPSGDFSAITGWSASANNPYFNYYPTANTLHWQICNGPGSDITPGSSTVWNVGAK